MLLSRDFPCLDKKMNIRFLKKTQGKFLCEEKIPHGAKGLSAVCDYGIS